MVAWNETGATEGGVLGGAVDEPIQQAVRRLLANPDSLEVLDPAVDDTGARQVGLSCGGAATVVVQSAGRIPGQLWPALADRRPVALATDIDRIHGPIGLDLGGNRPVYIALAICAEILAGRNRRDAVSLRGRTAPIRAATAGADTRA